MKRRYLSAIILLVLLLGTGSYILVRSSKNAARAAPRPRPAAQSGGITTRVSVASDGTQGNGDSYWTSISADGRYVAFLSWASNLVPGDTNGSKDIFVHDRQTGQTTRVSVASDGTQGDWDSDRPSISADGRYVAFESVATNLVPDDTNGRYDIFVHDRQTGQTTRVSVASDGTQGDGRSRDASISADGRYVAFESVATNLVPDDTNGSTDVFVHDGETGQTTRVSVASDGTQGDGGSEAFSISADGRYVAFLSWASNLVPGDTNTTGDIFVHDRETGQTTRVSVASDGTEGDGHSGYPSISADGRYVAFESYATNLVPDDTNANDDIFVHDRETGQTTRVSVASDGTQGNAPSYDASNSADGRYVAFESWATNLVLTDTNATSDIFVHDRETGQTTRVSVASDGTQGNAPSYWPCNSADGRYVAFYSWASNLVPGDTNSRTDVFVHDRGAGGADTDEDGLLDTWEQDGIDVNDDGTVDLDLPAIGADPMHKDIFLEVDYMQHHRPYEAALQDVINAFANAPVSNPDGVDGINLHVIVDEEIAHQDVINVWADFDTIKDARFGTSAERSSPNWDNIESARRLVFRYCLFAHQYNPYPSSSGIAELPGNDFIVSLGAPGWGTDATGHNVGTRDEQAATFMHELGHTLGLRHGGGDDMNCKPNYLSVMSYSRQFRDIVLGRPLDYSRGELPLLVENNLDEWLGVQGSASALTVYGPPRDVDSDGDLDYPIASAFGPIDWDADGFMEGESVAGSNVHVNINYLGFWGCNDPDDTQTLTGYDDWANLLYNFRATANYADGVHVTVADEEITIEVVEEIREIADFHKVYLPLILRNH